MLHLGAGNCVGQTPEVRTFTVRDRPLRDTWNKEAKTGRPATLRHSPDVPRPPWTYRHVLDVGQELLHCCGGDAHVFKHPFQLGRKLKPTFCLGGQPEKEEEGSSLGSFWGELTPNRADNEGQLDLCLPPGQLLP